MKTSEMPAPGKPVLSLAPEDQSHNTNKIIQITNFYEMICSCYRKTGDATFGMTKKPRSLELQSILQIVIENLSLILQIPLDMDESGKL
jgi:hypothetical protein